MPISTDVKLGKNVVIPHPELVNLYGCEIGDDCRIGAFVEIGKGVKIGARCKIGAHAFIPPGVIIEDDVFIGPRATFTNDKYPKAVGDWEMLTTIVQRGASIGAGAIILCGITIGADSLIGAGSVVTKNVRQFRTVYGNPARE